jgi:hypothetical protein
MLENFDVGLRHLKMGTLWMRITNSISRFFLRPGANEKLGMIGKGETMSGPVSPRPRGLEERAMKRFHVTMGVLQVEVAPPSVSGEKWVGMIWRKLEVIIGGGR